MPTAQEQRMPMDPSPPGVKPLKFLKGSNESSFGKMPELPESQRPKKAREVNYHCCSDCNNPFIQLGAEITCPSCMGKRTAADGAPVERPRVAKMTIGKAELMPDEKVKMRDEELNYADFMSTHADTEKNRKYWKKEHERLKKLYNAGYDPNG